jgi:hypothetical protein
MACALTAFRLGRAVRKASRGERVSGMGARGSGGIDPLLPFGRVRTDSMTLSANRFVVSGQFERRHWRFRSRARAAA